MSDLKALALAVRNAPLPDSHYAALDELLAAVERESIPFALDLSKQLHAALAERDKLAAENAALVAKVAKLESGFVEMNQLAIDREHFHDRMIAEGQRLEAERDTLRAQVSKLREALLAYRAEHAWGFDRGAPDPAVAALKGTEGAP